MQNRIYRILKKNKMVKKNVNYLIWNIYFMKQIQI